VPAAVALLCHSLASEVELGGERIVLRAAQREIAWVVLAATRERQLMVEFEVVRFTATLPGRVDVGAARAIALEHSAPNASGDVSRTARRALRRLRRRGRRRPGGFGLRRTEAALFESLDQLAQCSQMDGFDPVRLLGMRQSRRALEQVHMLLGGRELNLVAQRFGYPRWRG
jgi:hypothetical protein